jgi:methylenetetrahydrofolate dehydrogenase (NADP+)/methenyltetrahydrofolate cyclohydrolase
VKQLVANDKIHGILVQLPLPAHLDSQAVLKLIPKAKDVDGFCEENIGSLCINKDCLVACTPNGVMKMLEREGISVKGKNAVVVGRSNIVGKPMAMLLLNADATVTVCHSKTQNLKEICRNADILVAAIGKAKFITSDMVKNGAVVIDVGMNRDENGKLCGDVDFENVKEKCSFITPVPGGVGPMTITMLLYNTYVSAERSVLIDGI